MRAGYGFSGGSGCALAYESHKTGVHMSFSPVLDVNTNPKNPIIGARSFGSDPFEVSQRGLALTRGMEGAVYWGVENISRPWRYPIGQS